MRLYRRLLNWLRRLFGRPQVYRHVAVYLNGVRLTEVDSVEYVDQSVPMGIDDVLGLRGQVVTVVHEDE